MGQENERNLEKKKTKKKEKRKEKILKDDEK